MNGAAAPAASDVTALSSTTPRVGADTAEGATVPAPVSPRSHVPTGGTASEQTPPRSQNISGNGAARPSSVGQSNSTSYTNESHVG